MPQLKHVPASPLRTTLIQLQVTMPDAGTTHETPQAFGLSQLGPREAYIQEGVPTWKLGLQGWSRCPPGTEGAQSPECC